MLTLTVVTGAIDAVSFLALGHFFVANMTGNVVFLGFALVGAAHLPAPASVVALTAFLVGTLTGGRLGIRFATHRGSLLKTATSVQTVLVAITVAASPRSPTAGSAVRRRGPARPGRRIVSVPAMFLGAFAGAKLVLHGHLVLTLSQAVPLLAVTSVATHRLAAGDPAWTRPPS